MHQYKNNAQAPQVLPVREGDELFEHTLPEEYDLNSYIQPPSQALKTELVSLEPLIPSLHAEALHAAFAAKPVQGHDEHFYPFPKGRPLQSKAETLMYIEKQRRRPNILPFAITDLKSNRFAGVIMIGCDPFQGTWDPKLLGLKIIPEFRKSHVLSHTIFLITSFALDPREEGGCGFVRASWRAVPPNKASIDAAVRMGFSREGVMRCYTVSTDLEVDGPYEGVVAVPDGTGRKTEDGVVFSMTCHDWLSGEKKALLKERIEKYYKL